MVSLDLCVQTVHSHRKPYSATLRVSVRVSCVGGVGPGGSRFYRSGFGEQAEFDSLLSKAFVSGWLRESKCGETIAALCMNILAARRIEAEQAARVVAAERLRAQERSATLVREAAILQASRANAHMLTISRLVLEEQQQHVGADSWYPQDRTYPAITPSADEQKLLDEILAQLESPL